jgi:hypothetical protein
MIMSGPEARGPDDHDHAASLFSKPAFTAGQSVSTIEK